MQENPYDGSNNNPKIEKRSNPMAEFRCNWVRLAWLTVFRPVLFCTTMLAVMKIAAGEPDFLVLPPTIYAVPGIETNVYFANIALAVNPANYVYEVDCAKGRLDQKRWRFIPGAGDAGIYPWKIRIYDANNHLAAQGETTLVVGTGKTNAQSAISVLLVGDSHTYMGVYPRRLSTLLGPPATSHVRFIGSHNGEGTIPQEGYGGWTWETFLTRWTEEHDYRAKSKFLTEKNGRPVLDFKAYCDRYNHGLPPEVITVMLGSNDIADADESQIEAVIKKVLVHMDQLLSEFHRVAPNAVIGVALPPPPAATQDAFGANYQCKIKRWQFRCNQQRLVGAMVRHLAVSGYGRQVSVIPVYLNLDTENNFPVREENINLDNPRLILRQNNALHPADAGYNQIGDTFYCWWENTIFNRTAAK